MYVFIFMQHPGSHHSTMSGRRLRNVVRKTLLDNGFPSNVSVVIAGLSNTYSDYVTTFEEYQVLHVLTEVDQTKVHLRIVYYEYVGSAL